MSDAEIQNFHSDGTVDETRAFQDSAALASRQAGTQFGDFRLLRRLGRGGMAEVWLAEQLSLKRNVALKLLRPELMEDENYVARFQTEAKAAAGLNHPNIVQVYTVGCDHGQHFIAQEYVHGQTLKALLLKKGPLELQIALMIIRQVASALQAAGEQGIVHRDIKPENIMLTRKGEAKVADFGLAQLQGGDRLKLTQEGITMGTPLYMSPEQVTGKPLDQRSDIYSLGVTCYHMFAGRPPFEGDNAVSVAVKHLHDLPIPLNEMREDLPAPIVQLVKRMMSRKPEDRYQSAQEIVTDVRKLNKAIRLGESVDELLPTPGARRAGPLSRPYILLPLLCALVFLLSSATGWLSRPRIPSIEAAVQQDRIPKADSAREQYLQAMFEIDNEEAFAKVIEYFPQPEHRTWHRRAYEQLALLSLRDASSAAHAEQKLRELANFDKEDPRLKAEADVGLAYLRVQEGQLPAARKILDAEQENFDQYLSGSWKQLEEDVRQRLRAEGDAVPANSQQNSRS